MKALRLSPFYRLVVQRLGRLLAMVCAAVALNLATTTTASAQTATCSSNEASHPAEHACDNNNGTRWGSALRVDPSWWKLDNGKRVDFNSISITWDNASAKTFKILATNDDAVGGAADVDPSQWTELISVTDNSSIVPSNNKLQLLRLSSTQSYRYVCFYGTARNTDYGYSFYEFTLSNTYERSVGDTSPFVSGALPTTDCNVAIVQDLGAAPAPYNFVYIEYEGADYATVMDVETSDDGAVWKHELHDLKQTASGFQLIRFGRDINSRYLRYNLRKCSGTSGYHFTTIRPVHGTLILETNSTTVPLGTTARIASSLDLDGKIIDISQPDCACTVSDYSVGGFSYADITSTLKWGKFTPKAEGEATITYNVRSSNGTDYKTSASPSASITLKVEGTFTATASKSAAGHGPELSIDGNNSSTYWSSGSVGSDEEVSLTFDYGSARSFDVVGIVWTANGAKHVRIEGSNDTGEPKTWTPLAETTPSLEVDKKNKFNEVFPIGQEVSYRYVRVTLSKPTSAANGFQLYQFYTDRVKAYYLNSVSHRKGVDNAQLTVSGSDKLFKGEYREVKVLMDCYNYTGIDASSSSVSSFTQDDGGAIASFDPANLRLTGIDGGTMTLTAHLMPYGSTGSVATTPPHTADLVYTVVDVADLEFVHTHGAADPENMHPEKWGAWSGGASSIDTEYLVPATGPGDTNPHADARLHTGVRQQTHVTEHLIYALPGETIYLTPYTNFYDYNQYEEKILRWYDYREDTAHPWLSIFKYDAEPNVLHAPYGIITGTGIGCTNRTWGTVAQLDIPSDAHFHEEPIIIAMDAAQDPADVLRRDGKFMEPLVNFRHLFIIYDAREHVADYSHSVEQNIHFTQVRKRFITARADTDFQVRLNYIMPVYKNHASGMLYESDTEDDPTYPVNDGETHGVNYRVGPSYVKTFDADGNEINGMFRLDKRSGSTYECAEHDQDFYRMIVCDAAKAKPGTYTVRLYASDVQGNPVYVRGSNKTVLLIAQEYEVKFVGPEVASFFNEEELAENASVIPHQQYAYLDKHYHKIGTVDFEDYSLNALALIDVSNASGIRYKWPVDWNRSNYAFGYHERHDYNMYMLATHSDLTPYSAAANRWPKEKNFPGSPFFNPSTIGGGGGLYDRLYYDTQGRERGYFYYVNAAGDPGIMARIPIDELCLGSTLFVTGWVAEFSDAEEKANIIFNFNVVLKDGRTVTLNSFTSGYVPTAPGANLSADQIYCGRWYKCYYSFVPHALDVDPALVDHYELTLENNCISSKGADYAIDDIRVWVSKPEVLAQQLAPLCHGERETEVKVSASFESLLATIGQAPAASAAMGKEYKIFYTLIDKEKYEAAYDAEPNPALKPQAALDAAIVDYMYEDFGDGTPSADPKYKNEPFKSHQKYGVLTFNSYFPANTQEYASGIVGSKTAMRETVNGIDYLVFNTLPHTDNLKPGKEYMVALWSPVNSRDEEADYENREEDVLQAANFEIGDNCAKVGEFAVISAGVIKINGEIVSSKDHLTVCRNQYPVIQIDVQGMVPVDPDNYDPADPLKSEQKMTVVEKNAPYDWFFGSYDEYRAAHYEEGGVTLFTLDEAIHCYREYYNGEQPGDDDISLAQPHLESTPGHHYDALHQPILFTQKMLDYLRELATTPVAALSGRPALLLYKRACPISPRIVNGAVEYKVTAVPIQRSKYWVDYEGNLVELGPDKVIICTDPTEIHVSVDNTGPVLLHGFAHDETYPETMDDVPLRIGYDQLTIVSQPLAELQKVIASTRTEQSFIDNDCVLTIPVRSSLSTTDAVTRLKRNGDILVYLYETNDPEYMDLDPSSAPIVPYPTEQADDNIFLPQVGLLLQLQGSISNTEIKADHDFFRIVFREDFHFKEGYYYRLRLSYEQDYPADYIGPRAECDGQTVMTLKVVPKYQMWIGDACTDFNDDHNWRRITSDELHHVFTGDDDPLRPKLADGYNGPTNTAQLQARATGFANRQSYVPMDFTDIIIPPTDHFPRLYHRTADDKWLTYNEEGVAYSWLWPEGRNDGEEALEATATVDIEYDMAAWTRTNASGVVRGVNCRPWYANTCEHVTFLPGAEIYGQQHLKYQRAWVELELTPDRWYTLTSPLQKTVAGDMYAPTLGARQLTEHFQPITFNRQLNDRFRPAVYQRSWDHKGMARIYRMDGDGMYNPTTDQSGQRHSIDDAYVAATWSHVFNDNEEVYTDGHGFSVLTDVSRNPDAASITSALFRLPKDDADYDYHDCVAYDENGQNGQVDAVARPVDHRHYGDNASIERGNPVTLTTDMKVNGSLLTGATVPAVGRLNPTGGTITVSTQNEGQYFLVGNPFMAHLDMAAFFDANPGLERKYWIVTEGRQDVAIMGDDACSLSTAGVPAAVAPMQGFFVEATTPVSRLDLTYNEQMMKTFDNNSTVTQVPTLKAPARRSGAASDGQLRLMLIDGERLLSTALIALSPAASGEYVASEDAILLLDSNLEGQAALYTVAGQTAVSINTLEHIDTVPLGTIIDADDAATARRLTLAFDGAGAFPQALYLYDALNDVVTPIDDDTTFSIPALSSGQYFITTGIDAVKESIRDGGPLYNLHGIRVGSTSGQRVVISQQGRKSVVR